MNEQKTRVLFLCTHNSARSQIAEALLREQAGNCFEAVSAGTETIRVHPLAIEAMRLIGIDISAAWSKTLEEYRQQEFDWVITVCDDANDRCPTFPGLARRLHWSLSDPSAVTGSHDQQLSAFIDTRDELNSRIESWLESAAS